MKREYLSLEDHRKVADELRSAEQALTRVLNICNGKVPAKIIDQLCSPGRLSLAGMRLREDLFMEMVRRYPQSPDIYYNDPSEGPAK